MFELPPSFLFVGPSPDFFYLFHVTPVRVVLDLKPHIRIRRQLHCRPVSKLEFATLLLLVLSLCNLPPENAITWLNVQNMDEDATLLTAEMCLPTNLALTETRAEAPHRTYVEPKPDDLGQTRANHISEVPTLPVSEVGLLGQGTEEERRADIEKQKRLEGNARFNRLGWKRLTIVLIVEAIALGSLGLPAAFATLGMIAGVITCVSLGLGAIYTSFIIGQVKLAFPDVRHYADLGKLLMGRVGYELFGIMFVLQLVFLVGSHCLTGTIAFNNMTNNGVCSLVFGLVSAIILLLLAIPPSFAEVAILGYLDFFSIIVAIVITIVSTCIQARHAPGGLSAVNWSAWPKEDLRFGEAFIAFGCIVFAYSFAVCQVSFMDEMHTPRDFFKSMWTLGSIQIIIYTLTGALVYAFVGSEVQSPSLLSAGPAVSKVAFGVALPVIFISGSINTTVVARYLHGRLFEDSVTRFINTPKGWLSWLGMVFTITIIAWAIAEAIPFFSDLLSISSSLFVSGFSFYLPAIMWFVLLRKGKWYAKENIIKSIANALIFLIGLIVLVGGLYASAEDIVRSPRFYYLMESIFAVLT